MIESLVSKNAKLQQEYPENESNFNQPNIFDGWKVFLAHVIHFNMLIKVKKEKGKNNQFQKEHRSHINEKLVGPLEYNLNALNPCSRSRFATKKI